MKKKYNLVGVDGNAYSIMGYVMRAMRIEGRTEKDINAYLTLAKSGNYDNLLAVSFAMIDDLNYNSCSQDT